ncbi:MAG: type II toxin-antitoxin system HicB family antitoxin [Terriglobia bacterium]
MNGRTFTAILHKEEGLYVAECPEVGTVSQGATIEEAVSNLKEATELYIEEFSPREFGRTPITTFEITHTQLCRCILFLCAGKPLTRPSGPP